MSRYGGSRLDPSGADVQLRAAGGVVWRNGAGGLEFLIIHRHNPAEWRLPKGKLRPGETPEEAATREVREETGILAEVEELLGGTRYRYQEEPDGPWYNKRVIFYLMRPVAGRVYREKGLDAVGFAPSEAALRLLTFDNEGNIVRLAVDALEARRRL